MKGPKYIYMFFNFVQRCHRCELTVDSRAFAMITNRMGPSVCFHNGCFTCATCKELLVDNIYFFRTGDIYCGRHYAELVYPRCSACDEVGKTCVSFVMR